jgi:hypothetical protein
MAGLSSIWATLLGRLRGGVVTPPSTLRLTATLADSRWEMELVDARWDMELADSRWTMGDLEVGA